MSASIHFANDNVEKEYSRWIKAAGEQDTFPENNFIGLKDALKAHFLIVDHFFSLGSGLGGIGPKNLDLLHSALLRQYSSFGGKKKWADDYEVIASVIYGLVMNHAFHDANKRTAFLCLLYLLKMRRRVPQIPKKEFEDFLVNIADHQLGKYSRYRELEKKLGKEDATIKYMAWYIRHNTRKTESVKRTITFKALDTTLRKHGFLLKNPNNNKISIVQVVTTNNFFTGKRTKEKVIGNIGFPSWTKQVAQGDLERVRQITNLTNDNGIDIEVFLQEHDPLNLLIEEYHDQLLSLAER